MIAYRSLHNQARRKGGKRTRNKIKMLPGDRSSSNIHDDGTTTAKMLTISHVMFTLVNLNIFRGARYFLKRAKKENVSVCG